MKTRRILTILAAVLMLCLAFTSCDLLPGGKNPTEHVCESVCGECGKCLDAECTEDACAEKCEGHEVVDPTPDPEPNPNPDPEPTHTCEHACETCGKCTDAECNDAVCAEKCPTHHTCEHACETCGKCTDAECNDAVCAEKRPTHHTCEHECEICGKCTDAECNDTVCAEKCPTHHTCEHVCTFEGCGKCLDAECDEDVCSEKCDGNHHECENPCDFCGKCQNECDNVKCAEKCACTTPVIEVNPSVMEMYAGDEIWLLFGVTVTDEGDDEVEVLIEDDQEFDASAEGTYVITYLAINKFGREARATRTITVLPAKSDLALEVTENKLGENKWQGNIINFKNKLFVELDGNYTSDTIISGVFHNNSNGDIVVSIPGDYGIAAIITANGVVIEGRDGSSGKLVNAANPVRTSSTASTLPSGKSVAANFAQEMTIPAGGYAIVIQTGYADNGAGAFDHDGRGFMNYNVIHQYGNVVRLLWVDDQTILTPYENQAPVVSGHTTTVYAGSVDFDINKVLEGVKAIDDKGTFEPTDDVPVEITIADLGGFNIEVAGTYTITLTATDGTLTTTVTRQVEVTTSIYTIIIGNGSKSQKDFLSDYVAIDKDLTKLGNYQFIIYSPAYNKGINFANGYGEAIVVNKYGEVVRIYDGANGKYYDENNKSGVQDATKCTASGYLTEAYNSRQEGEWILVGPNGNGNIGRQFILDNRTIGAKVVLPDVTFAAHECVSVCAKCGGCLDEACQEDACATKCSCHKCESICEICGKCTDTTCTEEICTSNQCQGHAHLCESKCEYCSGCTDSSCTEDACLTKCEGHSGHLILTIGSKKYEATENMWAKNTQVTSSNAANKAVWIFDKSYTGTVATNGYGVAVVLDAEGKVARVYDGANGGYWLPSGKQASAHFTTSSYATVAWGELQEGETLIVLPNGPDGNKGRQLGLDCRYLFGQKLNITIVE